MTCKAQKPSEERARFDRRRRGLLRWCCTSGIIGVLVAGGLTNGFIGLFDALWQIIIGIAGGVGLHYAGEGPPGFERLGTCSGFALIGACLAPVVLEMGPWIDQIGNGGSLTSTATLSGIAVGGFLYLASQIFGRGVPSRQASPQNPPQNPRLSPEPGQAQRRMEPTSARSQDSDHRTMPHGKQPGKDSREFGRVREVIRNL